VVVGQKMLLQFIKRRIWDSLVLLCMDVVFEAQVVNLVEAHYLLFVSGILIALLLRFLRLYTHHKFLENPRSLTFLLRL
jgi:hypothetical protein